VSVEVKFKVKCTSCKKVAEATPAQLAEARDMGCLFCAHCGSVATAEQVTVKQSRAQARRR
jgi:rRNA maturation endonuclease Nob1